MILVPIESAYATSYYSHCSNFGPILNRFTATYWLKIAHFPTPLLFGTPLPLEFRGEVNHEETRVVGLYFVTDGQMDGRMAIAYMLSRAKNR